MFPRVPFFIFLIYSAICESEGESRYEYDILAGGYLKLYEEPTSFYLANLYCKFEGAVLASPLNVDMREAMVKKQEASGVHRGIWTGIHDILTQGKNFASIEGVPLASIPVTWAPEAPNNFRGLQYCTIMLRNGSVAHNMCLDMFPYICYIKKATGDCGTFDPGYQPDARTSSCYKFHANGKTWRQAQMTCTAEGGHLAIINSDTEAMVLKEIFSRFRSSKNTVVEKNTLALGFFDWNKNGSWYTVDGQSLDEAGYAKWSPGQPDSLGQANCGAMFSTALLANVSCDVNPFVFICEKTPIRSLNRDEPTEPLFEE